MLRNVSFLRMVSCIEQQCLWKEFDSPMPADPCTTKLRSIPEMFSKSDSYSERMSMEVAPFGNSAPGHPDRSIASKVSGYTLY